MAKATPARPTSVKVGFSVYEIKYLDHDDWPSHDQDAMGVTYSNQCLINIRTEDEDTRRSGAAYHEQEIKVTLLHELMHACFHVSNLTDTIKEAKDPEELTCATLSPSLLAVLRDNPEVASYLLG
jgi:hypothetical protein